MISHISKWQSWLGQVESACRGAATSLGYFNIYEIINLLLSPALLEVMVLAFLPMRDSKILFWLPFTIFCTDDSLITPLTAIINGKC